MEKIRRFQSWLLVTISSAFVAASYQLEDKGGTVFGVPHFLAAILAFIVGAISADVLSKAVLTFQSIRKKVLGSSFVEGYWHIKTEALDAKQNPLKFPGVVFIHYEDDELSVTTTRFDDNENLLLTKSQILYVKKDGANLRYLNRFLLTAPGQSPRVGLSSGEFIITNEYNPWPDVLYAYATVDGDEFGRRQTARKIRADVVQHFQDKYGDRWIKEFLKADGMIPGLPERPVATPVYAPDPAGLPHSDGG